MPPASFKFDDTFAFVRPVQDGRTQVAYPFISNGDRGTRTYSRTLLQREANYVPAVLGFERDSVWEGGDPAAYLISETSPEPTGVGDLMRFTRTYARLPAQQTVYSSRLIDRPVMHDIKSGTNYAVSFDNGVTSHRFSSRISVSSIGAPAISYLNINNSRAAIGHQLINFELNTGSGSFYLDDADADIKDDLSTAFIGSTANSANFFISRYQFGLYISWAGISVVIKSLSVTSTDIEISDRTIALGTANSQGPIEFVTAGTNATSIRTITTGSAHSGAAGEYCALWNGDRIVAMVKPVLASGSSVTIRTSDLPGTDDAITHLAFAGQAAARYVNGPVSCTIKEVTDFYLPGVSTGITTPADIALLTPKLDPVSWLGEIIAATAYVVCEGSQLSRWLGGPMYQQTTISVQMSDAVDTVAVGA